MEVILTIYGLTIVASICILMILGLIGCLSKENAIILFIACLIPVINILVLIVVFRGAFNDEG